MTILSVVIAAQTVVTIFVGFLFWNVGPKIPNVYVAEPTETEAKKTPRLTDFRLADTGLTYRLEWTIGDRKDVLGFHLYVANGPTGESIQLTDGLIFLTGADDYQLPLSPSPEKPPCGKYDLLVVLTTGETETYSVGSPCLN